MKRKKTSYIAEGFDNKQSEFLRFWRIGLIFVLLVLAALCISAMAQENTSNYWMEMGINHLWAGSYKDAVNAFDKAVQIDPGNYEAWVTKGRVLTYLGRYNESIQAYDKASSLDVIGSKPEAEAPPLLAKAYTLMAIGRYDDAREVYENVTKLNFTIKGDFYLADGWRGFGNALTKLGRYNESLQAFDKAIELDPKEEPRNTPYAWVGIGNSLQDMGRHDEAIKAYDKALEYPEFANAGIAQAWKGKGDALNKLGKRDEALQAYDSAIKAYDNEIKAFNNASALDKAVSYTLYPYPVDAEFWYNKGTVLKALGRTSEADTAFAKARELGYNG